MCGRFALSASREEVEALFGLLDVEPFPPRYNIAPTQPIATVRLEKGARSLALVRWGLVPTWVKDPKSFALLINARSETAAEKAAFRAAMRRRRCLVPASGFYEWRRVSDKQKQPYWIRPRDGGLIAFAGLWETWSDPGGGEIDTGCIMTTAANDALAPIHERMPVVIAPADFDRWLNAADFPPGTVGDLLTSAPDDLFEAIPVSTRVNTARIDDPDLQTPIAIDGP